MPRRHDCPLHRLHVMVEEDNYQWLLDHTEPGEISALFRAVVKRLRGQKVLQPQFSLLELLDREELSL